MQKNPRKRGFFYKIFILLAFRNKISIIKTKIILGVKQMKKIKFMCLVSALVLGISGVANAGVTFLPAAGGSVGSSGKPSAAQTSEQKCKSAGYSRTSCGNGQILADQCPYNRSYYKSCCPEDYRFTKEECTRAGLRYSSNSCGGLYRCR